jgi:hypothetical protein
VSGFPGLFGDATNGHLDHSMEGPSSVAHFDDYHHDVHHHELSHSEVGVDLTGDDEINLSVVRGNGVRDKSPPISLLFDNVVSNTSSGSGRRGERDKSPSIASLGFIVPPLSGTNPPASADAGGAHNLLTPKSDLATSLLLNRYRKFGIPGRVCACVCTCVYLWLAHLCLRRLFTSKFPPPFHFEYVRVRVSIGAKKVTCLGFRVFTSNMCTCASQFVQRK